MLNVDYKKIANSIDVKLVVHREEDFVYLLYPDPTQNGNILFQEIASALVIWSNEYRSISCYEVFKTIYECTNVTIIFPFVETEEEYQSAIKLGATKFDFEASGCEDYSRKYGSFIIRK